jgi:hypothetical protein
VITMEAYSIVGQDEILRADCQSAQTRH